jgi:hypothetical protein
MPRIRPLFNNFTSGEVSPVMSARADTDQFRKSCKQIKNCICDTRGGIFSRPGILFAGTPKANNLVRFIPFIVSRGTSYIIEVGPLYFRFWKNDGTQIESSPGVPLEVVTPYIAGEISDIQYAQSNDVLYLVVDDKNPRKLTRVSETSWTLSQPTFNGAVWNGNADAHADGFPRTICFWQQRLVFGGRAAGPQTLWTSRVADFEEFAVGATNADDDPLILEIAATTQELIQWLAPGTALFVGTTGNEHRLLVNGYLAPSNPPDIARQSQYGSRYMQPLYIGRQVIFVQATGKRLRNYDLNINANVESYDSIDLSYLARHMTADKINQMAYAQIEESVVWIVTDIGELKSMTYDPSLGGTGFEAVGWQDHPVDGTVEAVGVIPTDEIDMVWTCIDRGGTRYIGYQVDDDYLLDASVIYDSTLATTISGFDHLEGETIQVVADGAVLPDHLVTSGDITLTDAARYVRGGLSYTQRIESQRPDAGAQDGTTQGRPIQFNEIFVNLLNSVLPTINGKRIPDRSVDTDMDSAEPLFTGDRKINNLGVSLEETIIVENTLPIRMQVLALHGTLSVGTE